MKQPHFYTLRRIQLQMRHFMLMLYEQSQQSLDVWLLEEEVILVERYLMNSVGVVLVPDLCERVVCWTDTHLETAFVVRLLSTVRAIKRAASTRRKNRVPRKA